MTEEPLRTPGTRITFQNLQEWIAGAYAISQRAPSAARYRAATAHFEALPDQLIRQGVRHEVEAFVRLINGLGNLEWHKPRRGHRGGTRWERANVLARNRLTQIDRQDDAASMMEGHNSHQRSR